MLVCRPVLRRAAPGVGSPARSGRPRGRLQPSPSPSASDRAAGIVDQRGCAAEVCDSTATPFIAGPDGNQLVLGNGPIGMSEWASPNGEQAFLRQNGDCIWIVGYVPLGDDEPPFLTVFHGRLGTDLRVVGTFSDITGELVPGYNHGDSVFRVTFEGEDVVLVADRTARGRPAASAGRGHVPSRSSCAEWRRDRQTYSRAWRTDRASAQARLLRFCWFSQPAPSGVGDPSADPTRRPPRFLRRELLADRCPVPVG